MSFRAFCLNTLSVSGLLMGLEVSAVSIAVAGNTDPSPRNAQRAGGSVAKSSGSQAKKSDKQTHDNKNLGQQSQENENIVVRAARQNRMYVSSGGDLGALGKKKGLDVPFNIRSYNSSLILNQQSQTLGDVLLNDPTVRTTTGYGNYAQLFQIRGFTLYGDDVAIDGLYGVTPRQLVSPQLYDSVQVLNGASAFLNGAAPGGSAIGGNVNLVPKIAGTTDITRLTGDYTSSGQGGRGLRCQPPLWSGSCFWFAF